jgi:hypothetical protein
MLAGMLNGFLVFSPLLRVVVQADLPF